MSTTVETIRILTPEFRDCIKAYGLDPDNFSHDQLSSKPDYIRCWLYRRIKLELKMLMLRHASFKNSVRSGKCLAFGLQPCEERVQETIRQGAYGVTRALVEYHLLRQTRDGGLSHVYK